MATEKDVQNIAHPDNWTQSKSTAGDPNANPEEFAEFVNEGKMPSQNQAQFEEGAKAHVELPSVAKGADVSEMKHDAEELGDPEAD
jgi:predicted homoserine dehydrogenase-like protein